MPQGTLTFASLTGKTVGKQYSTDTNAVHTMAQTLIAKLNAPNVQGPFSNLPYISLQMIGMQYDQSRANAVKLKMAEIAT